MKRDAEAVYKWFLKLCCFKRAMISFHYLPATTGDDKVPSQESLIKKVTTTLIKYHEKTGDFIPLLGVCAPRRNEAKWPHIHILLQSHDRDEAAPLVDEAALKRIGRKHWLKVTLSAHTKLRDSARETDLRRYVADHLWRHDAEVLPAQGVRTNFDKDRPPKTTKVKAI